MAEVLGQTIIIKIGSVVIGVGRGHSLQKAMSVIDVSSKEDPAWEKKVSGRRNWSFDFEGVYDYTDAGQIDVDEAFHDGSVVTVVFGKETPTTGDIVESGPALVSNISKGAPDNDAATFTCTLTGAGPLTRTVTT